MKFQSKFNNYRVILKSGIPAEPITGRAAVPAVFIKFEDGMVNVDNPELVEKLLNHPKCGQYGDFIPIEEVSATNWREKGKNEPEHDMLNLKHGGVEKSLNPKKKELSPELKKLLTEEATKMAKKMAGPMALEIVKELAKKDKEHIITKEDLDENPGLEKDVKVGDSVIIPSKSIETPSEYPGVSKEALERGSKLSKEEKEQYMKDAEEIDAPTETTEEPSKKDSKK